MALQVTSYSITPRLPWNAKVGERVDIAVDFIATIYNDDHDSKPELTLTGTVSDNYGKASGANKDIKTAHYGSTTLNTTVQASAIYDSQGWVTLSGRIQVYNGSQWVTILDQTQSNGFNVS